MSRPIGPRPIGSRLVRRRSILAAPALIGLARAAEPIRLRVSVETPPTHGRTISAADFLKKVEEASNGAFKTELFHSAQLFTDQNVVTALVQNQIEMSIPGSWGLAGFVPSFDVIQLPVMYARPADMAHRVLDGKTGQMIKAELEAKLHMQVLGRWLDLGFENWYTTAHTLNHLPDLTTLKIRNSGGVGKAWRTTFFGAIPNSTPWPGVALGLSQGTFDGLITTHETVASSSLWDSHVRYALEDHQTFNYYVPLMAGKFWSSLNAGQKSLLAGIWNDNVGQYRVNMAAAQTRARDTLVQHGITIAVPSAEEITSTRNRMLTQQDTLVKQWRITPDIAAQAVLDANQGA
jgi:TRAP-type C4-dicarboxylate transport system substrate-binding protein